MIRMRASAPERPRDLDQLLLGHRQPADLDFRVDRRANRSSNVACPRRRLAPADAAPAAPRLESDRDVFSDGEIAERAPAAGRSRRFPGRVHARDRGSATGWPRTSIVPSSGRWAPVITLISVDLPAPFSPTKAWTSPARRSNETFRKACNSGKRLADSRQLQQRRHEAIPPVLLLPAFRKHVAFVRLDFRQPITAGGYVVRTAVMIPDGAERERLLLFQKRQPRGGIAVGLELAQRCRSARAKRAEGP